MAKSLICLKQGVQHVLRKKGVLQAELANLMGMQPQQLSRQLGGHADVRISLLDRLAEALGCSVAYLLATPEERGILEADLTKTDSEIHKRLDTVERLIGEITARAPKAGQGEDAAIERARALIRTPQKKKSGTGSR